MNENHSFGCIEDRIAMGLHDLGKAEVYHKPEKIAEELKEKAKEYLKKHSEYSEIFNQVFICVDTLTALVEFATEVTKELQEENEKLKKIEEEYYDSIQKKNEEDWKGDNVVGCLNLRIEQKDKQIEKARTLVHRLLVVIQKHKWWSYTVIDEARAFMSEVDRDKDND